jgi:hypothetical protein
MPQRNGTPQAHSQLNTKHRGYAAPLRVVGPAGSTEVVEEYEDGYASQVRFVLDAAPLPQRSPNQAAGGLAGRLTAPVRRGQWNETVPGPVMTMLCERYAPDPVQASRW